MRINVTWKEYPKNPIIKPTLLNSIIADPTFLLPKETPDKKYHLFAHSLQGIHHFVAEDGLNFKKLPNIVTRFAVRPFLYKENDTYYLFYEKIDLIIPFTTVYKSRIEVRISPDLYNWSAPKTIAMPSLKWHKQNIGNPCVLKHDNKYFLYYSANLLYLWDCLYPEPKHIGLAIADNIYGPYKLLEEPLDFGAGSIKVLKTNKGFLGFANQIFRDSQGRSRSAIKMCESIDGITWAGLDNDFIVKPSDTWKKAFVYACDVRQDKDSYKMYFNARDGWLFGNEAIGFCEGKPMVGREGVGPS